MQGGEVQRMSVFIKGLNIKPCKNGFDGKGLVIIGYDDKLYGVAHEQIIPLPDHGNLIDIDALNNAMYHEAFETDSNMQKWDSGCWIRYKMFEKHRDLAPIIIPAERSEE